MTVIVTRPEPDGSAFARKLEARGMTAVLSPVIDIVLTPSRIDFSGVGALAFTSANGVRALAAAGARPGLPVFVVGDATAKAARESGHSIIETAEGDVETLAQLIAAANERGAFEGAVLHIAGAARAGDLVGALEERGMTARREVLYEARPRTKLTKDAEAALTANPPADWVALFSQRSARLFLEQVRAAGLESQLNDIGAACLSQAVAEVAGGARWRSIRTAAARTGDAMLDLMAGENHGRRS